MHQSLKKESIKTCQNSNLTNDFTAFSKTIHKKQSKLVDEKCTQFLYLLKVPTKAAGSASTSSSFRFFPNRFWYLAMAEVIIFSMNTMSKNIDATMNATPMTMPSSCRANKVCIFRFSIGDNRIPPAPNRPEPLGPEMVWRLVWLNKSIT